MPTRTNGLYYPSVSGNDNPRCPESPLEFSKKDDTKELDDSPDSSVKMKGQPDDFISSDEELTLTSLTDPPPAYEPLPQTIDINREGFNASAVAACKFGALVVFSPVETLSQAYRLLR